MITIRQETPADYAALYAFVRTAFETAAVSCGEEQDFMANTLRQPNRYIPALAFVAEEAGQIVGHVMLTHLNVPERKTLKMLLLAPLSVRLDKRKQGIGTRLVRHALQQARTQGFDAVALVGNPAYYGRFGFSRMDSFGLHCQPAVPAQYALALALKEGALYGPAATITF